MNEMKTLILILLIFASTQAFSAPNPVDAYGYWIVTYNTEEGYKTTPTVDIVDVYTIAETYFPGNCINFEKQLKESIFTELEVNGKSVYVEVKRINHKGKLKKLNKKEVREYLKK